MLELAILGLLKDQELHGYELKKRLAETVGGGISFGSLYPALNRLTAVGALRVVDASAAAPETRGRPESRGSRGKKVYGITEHGEQLFDELLAAETASSEDERSFNLRLAFARHLPRDARIGMMERRRAFLLDRLARTRITIRTGWGRLDAYTRSLMEHGNETTERDISWLERLIERERSEAPPHLVDVTPVDVTPVDVTPVAVTPADEAPAESAAVARASWAASTAPTMPARQMVRVAPSIPTNQATPINQPPAPPAHQRGGNIS